MSETPIGDASAADNGLSDPPATSPVDGAPDPSAPASPPADAGSGGGAAAPDPAPAPPAPDQAPFLVKSLQEAGPVRYGMAVGGRRVQYDVTVGTDPNTGKPIVEHVDFTELSVAWFDGEVGGAHADSVEPVTFAAQG